ncbi:HEPN family nuclease [Psychrilyobacter atlanticus]|uniref:HEPN family nuclease n=1 Tax=Psychrilyobacter atlanticus TaxID=271091 RepID=UPI0004254B90|nr:HEPN family nuclease [Psychrilyobacter atlanticus]
MKKQELNTKISFQAIIDELLYTVDCNRENKEITLNEILDSVYKKFEIHNRNFRNEHVFCNQHSIISALYTYLVLPKEKLSMSEIEKNELIKNLDPEWGLTEINPNLKFGDFIRRMRNAISHGNVECSKELVFKFTDINVKNKKDIFKITLEQEKILKFRKAIRCWSLDRDIKLGGLK